MTWHVFGVDGACDGLVEQVVRVGEPVPHGWSPAWTYEEPADDDGALQSVHVYISPDDRRRIISPRRRADVSEAHEKAIKDHVDRLTEATRVSLDLRYRGLGGAVVPFEVVENILAPSAEQWAVLTVRDGMATYESLVNAGCIPKFGGGSNFSLWALAPADEVDEAWVEKMDREIAKVTAPYPCYLEARDCRVPASPAEPSRRSEQLPMFHFEDTAEGQNSEQVK